MREPMLSKAYIYRPMPEAQRQKLSDAHHARLGIPLGFRRLYGVLVPDQHFEEVRKRAHSLSAHGKASKDDMRFFTRIILVMVEEGR